MVKLNVILERKTNQKASVKPTTETDPVCGMDVEPAMAAAWSDWKGKKYFFCSASCKQKFDADPKKYAISNVAEVKPASVKTPAITEPKESNVAHAAGIERIDLPVRGMSCASCVSNVEHWLAKTPGVRSASVNLATARATVQYDPAKTRVQQIAQTVKDLGYQVGEVIGSKRSDSADDSEQDARTAEYQELRRKFWIAAALSLPVLVIAMSHGRISFPGMNWVELALTVPVVFYCGWQFFRGAGIALMHRAADMNTLIAIGTGAAFVYSVAATFFPSFFVTGSGHSGIHWVRPSCEGRRDAAFSWEKPQSLMRWPGTESKPLSMGIPFY